MLIDRKQSIFGGNIHILTFLKDFFKASKMKLPHINRYKIFEF